MPEKGTASYAPDDTLEGVLGPLFEQSFVLTDRDGIVTRWTPRAEALFGWEGSTAVGHALLDTLVAAHPSTPAVGRLETTVRHRDGREFPVEFTFIPVPMSHSLEFNGFLESLESKRPREAILRRVQSQYSDVLDWIGSVVEDGGVPLHSDEMTAGTIVTFLPRVEAPWSDADVETPEEPGAAAPEGASEALAQVVDRAAEALARSDALEATLGEAAAAVSEARSKADAAHEQASAAVDRVGELGTENAGLRAELDELRRNLADQPRPEADANALAALREEMESMRAAAAEAAREEVRVLREELATLRAEPEAARPEELERLREEIELLKAAPDPGEAEEIRRLRADVEALREELGSGREGEAAGASEAIAAADRAEAALAAARKESQSLRAELEETRARAERAIQGAEAARRDTETAADSAGEARRAAEAAEDRAGAVAGAAEGLLDGAREAADAAGVEAKVSRVQAEAARVHAEEAGAHAQAAREVAEVLAGAMDRRRQPAEVSHNGTAEPAVEPTAEPRAREPRDGFDDADRAMATIALDGRFRELNPSFSDLVGFSESDFQAASWPPVADRAQLDKHREQMRAMLAGEAESAEVNTGYVHAQGLLVPVAGTLSLVSDEAGEPSHFLLDVRAP